MIFFPPLRNSNDFLQIVSFTFKSLPHDKIYYSRAFADAQIKWYSNLIFIFKMAEREKY